MQLHIYTEGDHSCGLGHIIRCMAYAEAWRARGGQVIWWVDGDALAKSYLRDEQVHYGPWQTQMSQEVSYPDAYALLDSYRVAQWMVERLASGYGNIICLDDEYRLNYPRGFVVHGAPGETPASATGATWLCGPMWQPLRPAFWALPASREPRESVQQILIIMGGTDVRRLLPVMVSWAQQCFPAATLHAIVAAGGQDLPPEVICHHHLDDRQMAALMTKCDLAISAAGQTTFELLAARLPAVLVQVADNQASQMAAWHQLGVFISAGAWDAPALQAAVFAALSTLANKPARQVCLDAMTHLSCGKGAPGLVGLVLGRRYLTQAVHTPHGTLVPFACLSRQQSLRMLALRNDPRIAEQMMQTRIITEEEHLAFVERQKSDLYNVNYALMDEQDQPLGMVALQGIDWCARQASLGIYKNVDLAVAGLGGRLMSALRYVAFQQLQLASLSLGVKADNLRARAFYQKQGFTVIGPQTAPLLRMQLSMNAVNAD